MIPKVKSKGGGSPRTEDTHKDRDVAERRRPPEASPEADTNSVGPLPEDRESEPFFALDAKLADTHGAAPEEPILEVGFDRIGV